MINNVYFVLGMATPAQKGFQPAYSPVMEGIIDLHHYICFFLILILIFVSWTLGYTLFRYGMSVSRATYYNCRVYDAEKRYWNFPVFRHKFVVPIIDVLYFINNPISLKETKKFSHWTNLEIAWTILPSLVLLSIAVPSFVLLYSTDEMTDNFAITIKAIGHQWYWSYEYVDLTAALFSEKLKATIWDFDSYMVPWTEVPTKPSDGMQNYPVTSLRLLGVDNPIYLPVKTPIRFLISASDVLHSFAVPSLGIKTDAVPGRLNQTLVYVTSPGMYFGQCSEICGVNHGFMPIQIIALPWNIWADLISNKVIA